MKTENEIFEELKRSVSAGNLQVELLGAKIPQELPEIEKNYWNNYINVLVALERKLCKGEQQWFAGVSYDGICSLLNEMRETAKQLKWPVKAYQPPQNTEYKLKVRPVVALLHGVYDLNRREIISPIRFLNPELPKISIDMNAEILGDSFPSKEGITIELPADYMQIIFGLPQRPQPDRIEERHYIMKPGTYTPPAPQPTITSAAQITRLQQQP